MPSWRPKQLIEWLDAVRRYVELWSGQQATVVDNFQSGALTAPSADTTESRRQLQNEDAAVQRIAVSSVEHSHGKSGFLSIEIRDFETKQPYTWLGAYGPSDTFGDLIARAVAAGYDGRYPHFWLRGIEPTKNVVTNNNYFWERQNPGDKLLLRQHSNNHPSQVRWIETIFQTNPYGIAILWDTAQECARSIVIRVSTPRTAIAHVGGLFAQYAVQKLLWLKNNTNADNTPFDIDHLSTTKSQLCVQVTTMP